MIKLVLLKFTKILCIISINYGNPFKFFHTKLSILLFVFLLLLSPFVRFIQLFATFIFFIIFVFKLLILKNSGTIFEWNFKTTNASNLFNFLYFIFVEIPKWNAANKAYVVFKKMYDNNVKIQKSYHKIILSITIRYILGFCMKRVKMLIDISNIISYTFYKYKLYTFVYEVWIELKSNIILDTYYPICTHQKIYFYDDLKFNPMWKNGADLISQTIKDSRHIVAFGGESDVGLTVVRAKSANHLGVGKHSDVFVLTSDRGGNRNNIDPNKGFLEGLKVIGKNSHKSTFIYNVYTDKVDITFNKGKIKHLYCNYLHLLESDKISKMYHVLMLSRIFDQKSGMMIQKNGAEIDFRPGNYPTIVSEYAGELFSSSPRKLIIYNKLAKTLGEMKEDDIKILHHTAMNMLSERAFYEFMLENEDIESVFKDNKSSDPLIFSPNAQKFIDLANGSLERWNIRKFDCDEDDSVDYI